ncbi:DNA polymerase III subunit delta [Bifidobacterium dolichotidis]|nr:DNA polymerase III subunit delta [Bifidobacterium dolichotidis]
MVKASSNCIVVYEGDEFLNRRQVLDLVHEAEQAHPDRDTVELDATQANAADFDQATSPSLLSDSSTVIVWNYQNADEDLIQAIVAWLKQLKNDPDPSFVILSKAAGQKGKRAYDQVHKAGADTIKVPDLAKPEARLNYVLKIFEQHKHQIEPMAAQQLVSVYGDQLGELTAMCEQLCFDFDEPITLQLVQRYLIGNPQVTGFNVADMAVAGNAQGAVIAMRDAIKQGIEPIALIGALAMKLRTMAKASAVNSGQITHAEAKMAPWMLRNATKQVRGWTSAGLSRCIRLLAWADEQCKTNGSDPSYALERCILSIAAKGMR